MKRVLSLLLALSMILVPNICVRAESDEIVLDGVWDFEYYADKAYFQNDISVVKFEEKIKVPSAMEIEGYGAPSYRFEEEMGWQSGEEGVFNTLGVYKKDFTLSSDFDGELVFEAFLDNLTAFIDSEKVLESKNAALGANASVQLKKGKHSLVCVVEKDKSGINKIDDFALSGITGSVKLCRTVTEQGKTAREVKISDGKLFVDGKEVVIRGIDYTPTHPETGNVMTKAQIEEDLKKIKEYGFNTVRVVCAPSAFYETADKLGLFVLDEANVNLNYANRDEETAKKRIKKMVSEHKKYDCVIMWSAGYGDASRSGNLVNELKKLDNRPVAQQANFADDFEVFGNTGGMQKWVDSLGNGNIGGFVDEFADKELYYTKRVYDFKLKDDITREDVNMVGEIVNYNGADMLADGVYERKIGESDKFTVLSYISNAERDRVIFETNDKKIRLETKDYRIRLTCGGEVLEADGGEGKVAIVYADGEVGLFTSRSFKENALCDVKLKDGYTVGEGDGGVLIKYVKIYSDALTLDELVLMTGEDKLISSVAFDDIQIKSDKSYKFLAYGGDFGDFPNSYYKCLTGIFTSTREAHPEAEAFREAFEKREKIATEHKKKSEKYKTVTPEILGDKAVFKANGTEITVGFDGRITNAKKDGVEMLSEAMVPTTLRDRTLYEYEMGYDDSESWIGTESRLDGDTLLVELESFLTEGNMKLSYTMYENGTMVVSMQTRFADDATKPTFVGFNGVGEFDEAVWLGDKVSTYPDRRTAVDFTLCTSPVKLMGDNYAVPQENGNRRAISLTLKKGEKKEMTFNAVSENRPMEIRVVDYSPMQINREDHDEDVEHSLNAYFRIGGHIAGVSEDKEFKLGENVYGFDFEINLDNSLISPKMDVTALYLDEKVYDAFATGVKNYVYRTNETPILTADGCEVVNDGEKAVAGDYNVYFAPESVYLSEMEERAKTAEIAKNCDFNNSPVALRGSDYWAPSVQYDKGIAIKNGSVSYDVSKFGNHVFRAVVGKNDIDWRKGGFDRGMFEAECDVVIKLDGEVVERIEAVSMRSGAKEVAIDVSNASEMEICVTGSGRNAKYEDAMLADASFVPRGPIVLDFTKKDGQVSATVLNTDLDEVDVILIVCDGDDYSVKSCKVQKGLYNTITAEASENAMAKLYVTDLKMLEAKTE